MKFLHSLPAIFCLLLGIVVGMKTTNKFESAALDTTAGVGTGLSAPDIGRRSRISNDQDDESLTQFPPRSIEHLQALEKVEHKVEGSSLVANLPRVFTSSFRVSGALVGVMELEGDEQDQLESFLGDALNELGRKEAELAVEQRMSDGSLVVSIPSFAEEGAEIREALLSRVEASFGAKRRSMLEMFLLNDSGILGNFGSEPLRLSHPGFEETYKREDLITLQVQNPEAQSGVGGEAQERAFFISDFQKRFGHLFDLESE